MQGFPTPAAPIGVPNHRVAAPIGDPNNRVAAPIGVPNHRVAAPIGGRLGGEPSIFLLKYLH